MQDNNAARQWAEQAASTRLLNCYLRETMVEDALQSPYVLLLIRSKRSIRLTFRYVSLTGHHRYMFPVWGKDAEEEVYRELTFSDLLDWLLAELDFISSARLGPSDDNKAVLKDKVLNSVQKTTLYIHQGEAEGDMQASDYGYVRSEQSLYFGHPFHPAPKSSEGFTEWDVEQYAPERKSSFKLEYWLVHPELFQEEWLSASSLKEAWLAKEKALVASVAREHERTYRLLPCHPWQARYMKQRPTVQLMIDKGKLRWVGSLENEPVFPTASVRTVWSPEQELFLKLPLHVRITNFVRSNSPEQCRRSMDAAQVWKVIGGSFRGSFRCKGFGILQEHGSLCIRDADLAEETAVLFRESAPELASPTEEWHVVASMLEDERRVPDWLPTSDTALKWVERYTSVYLFPVLKLFAEEGFGLEAHVQNTLICLEDGLPVRCLVRDLEGVSISRKIAKEKGWIDTVVPSSSPVLYNEEEAWMRWLYYNLTNHMSHMLAAVSRSSKVEEKLLWDHSCKVISEHVKQNGDSLRYWVNRLVATRKLPAKANLISWFASKGETPEYVELSNPYYEAAAVEALGASEER